MQAVRATSSPRCSTSSGPSSRASTWRSATSRRPVAPPGTEPDGVYPTYGVPAEIVVGLRTAGFDRCSLASNHTMDKGAAGIDATLAAFDAGRPRSRRHGSHPSRSGTGDLRRERGARRAHLRHPGLQRAADPERGVLAVQPDRSGADRRRCSAGASRRCRGRHRVAALGRRGRDGSDRTSSERSPRSSRRAAPSISSSATTRTSCSRSNRSTVAGSSSAWATC